MLGSRILKRILKLTPYEIRRRQRSEHGAFDVIGHNSPDGMDRAFSDPKFFAGYNSPGRQLLHKQTLDWIVSERPRETEPYVVGDFGCGPADFFALMARTYSAASYFGYDFSPVVLKAAETVYPDGTYRQHDIYTDAPRQHDITICSQTLEHLLEPEVALQRLLAATKAGGILVLTVPNGRLDTYRAHINFWSPESWQAWLVRNTPGKGVDTRTFEKGSTRGGNLGALIRV